MSSRKLRDLNSALDEIDTKIEYYFKLFNSLLKENEKRQRNARRSCLCRYSLYDLTVLEEEYLRLKATKNFILKKIERLKSYKDSDISSYSD